MTAHPDDAAWERLAMGEASEAERAAALAHAAACAECTRIRNALDQLEEGARAFDPAVAALRPRPRRRLWPVLAGLAAAAAIVFALRPGVAPPPPVDGVRSAPAAAAAPRPLQPAGDVQGEVTFRWSPMSGARSYRVVVIGDDGRIAWESTETAEITAAASLPPGRYTWQVIARPRWSTDPADSVASAAAAFSVTASRP